MIYWLRTLLNIGSGITSILVVVTLVIELIFMLSMASFQLFNQVHYYIFLMVLFDSLIRLMIRPAHSFGYRRLLLGMVAIFPILNYHGISLFPVDVNLGVQQSILFIIAISRRQHLSFLFEPLRANPTQSFVGGFILMILLGAIFLMLPMAHYAPISWIDAVFIAASAVCVTGLSVVDVGTHFTPVGQFVLLILIQIGGLGIMTFYALVTLSLHHRFLSNESQALQRGLSTENANETSGVIRAIIGVTLVVESLGAVCLFFAMPDTMSVKQALFSAIFHSVSAFCNAGFSLFSDSLAFFSQHVWLMMVVAVLILVGGIGFPVIFELYHRYYVGDRQRLRLQTKMAVYVSLILLVLGSGVIAFQSISTPAVPLHEAIFHSVSARTAGFSVTNMAMYSTASLWFMMFLMIIGASPGSTGGGIKTTTFGLLLVALFNGIKGRERIHVFDRHVKPSLVFKALAILTMSFFIIFISFFILLMTETIPFFPLLFETVSAFATVGLSLGVTSELSSIGKVVMIFLMFFGRVGPLTLAVALTRQPKPANYQLPNETILLG
jgi:trk system potassium uptake protein TrkH